MGVHSRIVPPREESLFPSDDYDYRHRSPSLTRADPHLSARDDSGTRDSASRGSRVSGSAPSNIHGLDTRTLPRPNSGQLRRSHISVSSEDTDSTEVLVLRAENTRLKLELHRVQGNLNGVTYVPILFLNIHTLTTELSEIHTTFSSNISATRSIRPRIISRTWSTV